MTRLMPPTLPSRWRLSAAVLLIIVGCAPDRTGWYEPDWDNVLDREAQRTGTIDDTPRARRDRPTAWPDFLAEGPVELSVEQAAMMALRQNRDLVIEQLNPVIADAFERIERGRFDPELFADAQWANEEVSQSDRATGQQFSVRGTDTSGGVGLRQELPTGTDLALDVTQQRSVSNRSPEQQDARLGLSITQSLLRGFGTPVNLATIRQAELDTLASRYELRAFTEALLAETEVAYWRYVLAREQIAIFEQSLAIAKRQREQVDQRIEVGVLAPTEAAAARSEVALREQALIDARSDLTARRLQLLRRINATTDRSFARELDATTDPAIETEPIDDLDDRLSIARHHRPDLNEARLRLEQNRLETVMTRNGLLPQLDLFVAVGKTGFADTFRESFREIDGPTYDATAGVSFSHYLGDRAAEGEHRIARARRRQAAAAIDNLEQLLELDVRLAVNEAQRTREQIAATAATRELQEQTVASEIERFEVGTSTALLVAQAQRDLLEAQIAEVEAVINHRIALVELYLAEGSLLERRGIRLAAEEPAP